MKIKKISNLNYDPAAKTLNVVGTSALGKPAKVQILVDDPDALALRTAGALLGKRAAHPDFCSAPVAETLQVGILGAGSHYVVAFRFLVGTAEFTTMIGITHPSEERLRLIQTHLDKALTAIAGQPNPPPADAH